MSARDFKELLVWQKSMALVKQVYLVLEQVPEKEEYGLKSQIRRCSVSIPSNLAEGSKRATRKDFLHFVKIANGSLAELETQLLLLKDIYSVSIESELVCIGEIGRMLNGLIASLTTEN